jgi:pectin methylesterase-like acyl-CoA thioesterase
LREAIDCGTQNGDRIQIKAGNYNETLRITKPMTLATDRGTVSIGRP